MTMDEAETLRAIREELKQVRRVADEILARIDGTHAVYHRRRCAECFGEVMDEHYLCSACLHKGEVK